jgi:hypothetical protein
MRSSLLPIMFVVAVVAAIVMWQSLDRRKLDDTAEKTLIEQHVTARFVAFDALGEAVKRYRVGHGGQVPGSIDEAVKYSADLFPADVMERDQTANHNLSQAILLTNVNCARPGDGNQFQYEWAIFLYVPKATAPEGFPQTVDFLRWSGEANTPTGWAGGFTAVSQASLYFGPTVMDAAKEKAEGATTQTAGQP